MKSGDSVHAIIQQAELAYSKNGTEQIAFVVDVFDENGAVQTKRYWHGLTTDKQLKNAMATLKSWGWSEDHGFENLSQILGVEGKAVLEADGDFLNIKYLNGPHAVAREDGPVKLEVLPQERKQSIAENMRARMAALKNNNDDIPY